MPKGTLILVTVFGAQSIYKGNLSLATCEQEDPGLHCPSWTEMANTRNSANGPPRVGYMGFRPISLFIVF